MLTEAQFKAIMPVGAAAGRLDAHWPYIVPALTEFGITTPARIAAFLAQVAHESGEYRYMEEIADGSAYEGRSDLGNTFPGDGTKYKGHGPIQITGRANHALCGAALGLDLVAFPTLITLPQYGTRSAGWFWKSRGLNELADGGDFEAITRRINGGTNGWDDRVRYWERAKAVLGLVQAPAASGGSIEPVEAIKRLQAKNGLVADGVVGPKTRAALGI